MFFLAVLLIHGLAVLPSFVQHEPYGGSAATEVLLELEEDRAAAVASRDATALAKLFAEGSRFVTADGRLLTGAERLAAVSGGEHVERPAADPPSVRIYDSVALVSGRILHERSADLVHVYFLRVWVREEGGWRIFMTHETDITPRATADPPAFAELEAPVPAGRVDPVPEKAARPEAVIEALRRSHLAYWAKNSDGYRRFAGEDLVRAAENGVRPGAELIAMMEGNPRLPATPSRQLQMWARVFGGAAVGGWLDAGKAADGTPSRNRFTAVLVWRDGRWQLVQLQSNAAPVPR